jgi:hypothetical protein
MNGSSRLENWDDGEIRLADLALASEGSLAKCWKRPEEDLAWAYMQGYMAPPYPLIGWKNDPQPISSRD